MNRARVVPSERSLLHHRANRHLVELVQIARQAEVTRFCVLAAEHNREHGEQHRDLHDLIEDAHRRVKDEIELVGELGVVRIRQTGAEEICSRARTRSQVRARFITGGFQLTVMVVRMRLLVVLENRLVVALHLSEDVPAILEHDSHVVQNVAAQRRGS